MDFITCWNATGCDSDLPNPLDGGPTFGWSVRPGCLFLKSETLCEKVFMESADPLLPQPAMAVSRVAACWLVGVSVLQNIRSNGPDWKLSGQA